MRVQTQDAGAPLHQRHSALHNQTTNQHLCVCPGSSADMSVTKELLCSSMSSETALTWTPGKCCFHLTLCHKEEMKVPQSLKHEHSTQRVLKTSGISQIAHLGLFTSKESNS